MTDKKLKWSRVMGRDEMIGPDFIRKFSIGRRNVIIIKKNDDFFAVSARCPHAGADLSNGWCASGNIVCPYHRHEFDLRTGRGKAGQGNYINTFPIEIREDGLYCGVKKSFWFFFIS